MPEENGAQVGLIGLAVMGQNLALNIEQNGFPIAVFNRTGERTREFVEGPALGTQVRATYQHQRAGRRAGAPRACC